MTSRRQSCDRCHGQKLRCTRTGNSNTGACDRCLRQGAQCVYSFNLPKGRPSTYRVTEEYRAAPQRPAVSVRSISSPVLPNESRRPPQAKGRTTQDEIAPVTDVVDTTTDSIGKHNYTKSNDTTVDDERPIPSPPNNATLLTTPWTWPEPIKWSDFMNMDDHHDYDQSTLAAQMLEDASMDVDTTAHSAYTTELPKGPFISTSRYEQTFSPDVGIAQLSQLTTRLHPLQSSSCNLTELLVSSTQSSPLVDDATFQSVVSWLLQVSANLTPGFGHDNQSLATGKSSLSIILVDAFASSRQLLGILRSLQADVVPWSNITPPQSGTSTTSSHTVETSYFEQSVSTSSGYIDTSHQYSKTVICHLIMACHTLLLRIYLAVLTAVQHNVDHQNGSFGNDRDVDGGMSDFRLAIIVQFCSYFVERQCQAADSYLSPQPSQASVSDGLSATQPRSLPESQVSRGAMEMLEKEVQQRILRLRKTLRF